MIDCKELRLSVTTTTLTIFNEKARCNAWRMVKSSEVMEDENLFIVIEYRRFLSALYIPQPARSEVLIRLYKFEQTDHIYCANAKRKPVQRMQMPSDGQTARE